MTGCRSCSCGAGFGCGPAETSTGAASTPAKSIPPNAFKTFLRIYASCELVSCIGPQRFLHRPIKPRPREKFSLSFLIAGPVYRSFVAVEKALIECACHDLQMASLAGGRFSFRLRHSFPRRFKTNRLRKHSAAARPRFAGRSRFE